MLGKVPPDVLTETILTRTGASMPEVRQGAAYGEDTAAIDLGEDILVVNADPISMAAGRVGTLGVHVVCNDVAASGARPRWLTNTMFLPDPDPDRIDQVTAQLDAAAAAAGVSIVGGHAEYAPERSRPLLSLTALGLTDRYIPSGGGTAGDAVLLTDGAGIEGSAILATDFREALREAGVDEAVLERAADFTDEISVIEPATAVRDLATGMHDPTEGGVLAGLVEMATAADRAFEIERESIPIRPETATLCEAMDVDPLCIFGSGALLITVADEDVDAALEALAGAGATAAVLGSVASGAPAVRLGDESITSAPRDELYDLWT